MLIWLINEIVQIWRYVDKSKGILQTVLSLDIWIFVYLYTVYWILDILILDIEYWDIEYLDIWTILPQVEETGYPPQRICGAHLNTTG